MPCQLVLVGVNLVDNSVMLVFDRIQLALFLLHSVSPIIICSILHCVLTIFYSCVLLRDNVSLPYVITGSMHSLCTFIFNLHGMLLFQLAKSSPTKAFSAFQLLFLIVVFCHHLSDVDVAVDFFNLPSIDVTFGNFVYIIILHICEYYGYLSWVLKLIT